MGKIKSHKASAKRFSLTKSGKLKMNHMSHRHNLGIKSTKRKRSLRKASYMSESTARNIKTILPYA
jgi:large subunit ribosomal protein L35